MELTIALVGLGLMSLSFWAGHKKNQFSFTSNTRAQAEEQARREAGFVVDDLNRMLKLTTQTSEAMIDKLSEKIEEAREVMEALNAGMDGIAYGSGRDERQLTALRTPVKKVEAASVPQKSAPATLSLVEKQEEQRTRQIIGLQRAGYPPQDIAQMLNMGTGEVQLILSLNKKR